MDKKSRESWIENREWTDWTRYAWFFKCGRVAALPAQSGVEPPHSKRSPTRLRDKSEVRGQKSEVRGQRSEVSGQRSREDAIHEIQGRRETRSPLAILFHGYVVNIEPSLTVGLLPLSFQGSVGPMF
jgi:hypothetical protein